MGSGVAPRRADLILRSQAIQRLTAWQSARLAALLKRAGMTGNPLVMAGTSVRRFLYAVCVAVPLGALGWAIASPWLALVCAMPVVILMAPELRLRDEVARRREGVESELPFFSVLVGVLGGAGVPLYLVLRDLSAANVFPSMRREALLVKRDVEIFGMNAIDSLERVASVHPSKKFAGFVVGYTSKVRSGGDVPLYLSAESGSLLRELEEGWVRYVARIGIVGSMMITVFGVVPLLLMVVGVFSPGFSIFGLVVFTGVGVPLFTLCLLYLAGRMQPAREEVSGGSALKSALLALPFAAVGPLSGSAWLGAAGVLLVFFVVYGVSVRRRLKENRAEEEGLSMFLRDLLEFRRQDYDLARAVIAIEAQGGYDPVFRRVLSRVATKLKAGVPIDEVRVETRSSLGKLAFLLLGEMSRSGGGSVDTVFQLSSFTDRMIEMRSNARSEMKPYLVMSYVSPLLLAFGVTFVGGVLSSFGSSVRPGLSNLHLSGLQVGAVPQGLSEVSDLLIVVSAASLGLIGAKITDLTVRNTLRASLNVAIAVAAIVVMAALNSRSIPGIP